MVLKNLFVRGSRYLETRLTSSKPKTRDPKEDFSGGTLCVTPRRETAYKRCDDWLTPSEDVPEDELKKVFDAHDAAEIHVRLVFDEDGVLAYCRAEPLEANTVNRQEATVPSLPPPSSLRAWPSAGPSTRRILDATDFDAVRKLGQGGYGTVTLVKDTVTAASYAMKTIPKQRLHPATVASIFEEQDILKRLSGSPWFSSLKASFHDTQHFYILMDYCPGGSLHSVIARRRRLTPAEVLRYAAQLIHALDILHRHSIVHGDIKAENLLVDADNHLVLADFGLSRDFTRPKANRPWKALLCDTADRAPVANQDEYLVRNVDFGVCDLTARFCGTSGYMAPEIYRDSLHSYAVDVWAAGVTLYKMMTGTLPFGLKHDDQSAIMVNKMTTAPLEFEVVLDANDTLSEDAQSLLRAMLEINPQRRPTIAQVKDHAFFQSIDWTQVDRREHSGVASAAVPEKESPTECALIPAGMPYEAGKDPYPWFEWMSPAMEPSPDDPAGDETLCDGSEECSKGSVVQPSTVFEKLRKWWRSAFK